MGFHYILNPPRIAQFWDIALTCESYKLEYFTQNSSEYDQEMPPHSYINSGHEEG